MLGRLVGFWAAEIFSSSWSRLLVGQFLVSDIGSDHFLVYQHMDMIRHQMPLLDPAFLAARQIVKHLAQMPLDLAEQQFLAVFGVNTTWYLHCQVA
jgi:hypothetical protein